VDQALYRLFRDHEESHWWFVARRHIVLDAIARHGGLSPGDTVLDVGCGAGGTLAELARTYRAIGTDASPHAVEFARERGLREVHLGYLETLPREGNQANAALLLDVIEHVDDDVALLREVRSRLAPGGKVFVTVPAYMWLWSAHDVVNHHKRRYDAGTLRRALGAAELVPERVTYFNTLLFPLALAQRLLSRKAAKGDAHAAVVPPPAPLNAALRAVFEQERRILPRRDLPFGVSLLAVASA